MSEKDGLIDSVLELQHHICKYSECPFGLRYYSRMELEDFNTWDLQVLIFQMALLSDLD